MSACIAGIPVWGPSDMIGAARAVISWTDETIGVLAVLPGRVTRLLTDVETLIARVGAVVDRTDDVVTRVEAVTTEAAGLIGQASAVADRADALIDRAGAVVAQADNTSSAARDLIAIYAPIAEQAAPLAQRFVEEFSADELRAAIRLVDQLPALATHLETDIMPILATLDRVGPNVHDLLHVLKDVRQAIIGIPGLRYLQRRGEREEAARRN